MVKSSASVTAAWQRSAWAMRSESIEAFGISLCRRTGTKAFTPLLLAPIEGTNRLYSVSNSQNVSLNSPTFKEKKSLVSHRSGFLPAGIPGALYRAARSDPV